MGVLGGLGGWELGRLVVGVVGCWVGGRGLKDGGLEELGRWKRRRWIEYRKRRDGDCGEESVGSEGSGKGTEKKLRKARTAGDVRLGGSKNKEIKRDVKTDVVKEAVSEAAKESPKREEPITVTQIESPYSSRGASPSAGVVHTLVVPKRSEKEPVVQKTSIVHGDESDVGNTIEPNLGRNVIEDTKEKINTDTPKVRLTNLEQKPLSPLPTINRVIAPDLPKPTVKSPFVRPPNPVQSRTAGAIKHKHTVEAPAVRQPSPVDTRYTSSSQKSTSTSRPSADASKSSIFRRASPTESHTTSTSTTKRTSAADYPIIRQPAVPPARAPVIRRPVPVRGQMSKSTSPSRSPKPIVRKTPSWTPSKDVISPQASEVSASFLKNAENMSVMDRAKALTHYVETQPKFCPLKERPQQDVLDLVAKNEYEHMPERRVQKPVDTAITPKADKVNVSFIKEENTSVRDKMLALQNYIDEQPKFRPAQVPR